MTKFLVGLSGALLVAGMAAAPAHAAPGKSGTNSGNSQGCAQRAQAAYAQHWSPRAAEVAQNERRCVRQEEFLALFTGQNINGVAVGTLNVSAPEGTTVVKTTQVLAGGTLITTSLECGPTSAAGLASCDLTLPGELVNGAPVTNVFTTADGRTITTTGTSFCNATDVPLGAPCP